MSTLSKVKIKVVKKKALEIRQAQSLTEKKQIRNIQCSLNSNVSILVVELQHLYWKLQNKLITVCLFRETKTIVS